MRNRSTGLHRKTSQFRNVCLAVLTISLGLSGGCGGGGGSGGADPPPGGPGGSQVPANPPPPPTVVYTGSTEPVTVNAETSGGAAELAFIGLLQARGFTDILRHETPAEGVYDETTGGPTGGNAHLQGRIAADGTGWYSVDYVDFRDGQITINGTEVTHILRTSGSVIEAIRIDWHNFRVESPEFNQSLRGSVLRDTDSTNGHSDSELDLVITDLPTGAALRLENVRLNYAANDSFRDTYDFAGRIYDSGAGFLDVSTATPLIFTSPEAIGPFGGGPWIARGRNGASVWLEPLSHLYVSLQLVPAGHTSPDQALRILWDTPFFLQVGLPGDNDPIAISEPDRIVAAGERAMLDGRMSHHPDGRLQRFRWQVLFAPPGSQAVVEDVDAFTTAFEPDLSGSYLVMLEVSDGVRSARDVTSFLVDPAQLPPDANMRFALPPDRVTTVGERITLDGTMISPRGGDFDAEFSYDWDVGQIPLEDGNGPTPSLVFDEPGLYTVFAEARSTLGGLHGADRQTIAVDRALPPIPAIASTPSYGLLNDIAVADVTGDGINDLVLAHLGNWQTDGIPRLFTYSGTGGGGFAAPVSVEGGAGGDLAVIDIGSDLRMDLATATAEGIELFRQSEQGRLESIGALGESPFGCSTTNSVYRSLSVGDLNADGRQDLIVQNSCRQHMEVFFQLADGSFDVPVVEEPNPDGSFEMLTVADVMGDGLDDVLIATLSFDEKARVVVFPGRTDGLLEAEVVTEIDGAFGNPLTAAADINDDGRVDVVVAISRSFFVYLQGNAGELELNQTLDTEFFTEFVALLDIDGDGRTDIYTNDNVSPLVYRQLENGTFDVAENIPSPLHVNTLPRDDTFDALAAADVNADGVDEVISVNQINLGFLFSRPGLTCGGSCDSSVKEKDGLDDRKWTKSDIREPLSFSRERVMRRQLERRVFQQSDYRQDF